MTLESAFPVSSVQNPSGALGNKQEWASRAECVAGPGHREG